jgi:SAM-dependent methyltransferase
MTGTPTVAFRPRTPDFYGELIADLLQAGVLDNAMRVLVLCGGKVDADVLKQNGFRDVVISNVDSRPNREDFLPYEWCYQDAEHLAYENASFDLCLVHSGLHHCHSPHRALVEMYRVARKAILLFEPYDNLMTRIGVRLNVGQEYEHAGVFCNGLHHGGVGDSDIPNFVYRFTEQEIIKTINCYAPYARHDIRFIHRMRVPWTQLRRRRNKSLYYVIRAAQPVLKLVETCLPRQSNNFAALILKPELPGQLHPWLRQDGQTIRLNDQWVAARYN